MKVEGGGQKAGVRDQWSEIRRAVVVFVDRFCATSTAIHEKNAKTAFPNF